MNTPNDFPHTAVKRISVSQKRQITLPVDFFNALGIESEVECFVRDGSMVIRPVREQSGEFDVEILSELIKQGLSGETLLQRFKETRRKVRPAVKELLHEAMFAASGKTESATYTEIFDA
ncbi:MAG: AbrB/MazE/SpoVT family DNA-binding domain-containing protein [Oscillospiraceae bacterium]|jgi:bifunctional DNA-binding transcriptional regulator/antitoxin component of YhaV-PrlF toxin-antitoxin module|nr:AbrB/MazE/SpoVT family DNA-binding domain-containing protein [Oscillospiraceae bacterium]